MKIVLVRMLWCVINLYGLGLYIYILVNVLLKLMKLVYNVKVYLLFCFKFCFKKKILFEICCFFLDFFCLLWWCEFVVKVILFNVVLM